MYIPDSFRGTIGIMEQDATTIKIRSSYNLSGMSFSPKELAAEIKTHLPTFSISYKPDHRQVIADSWPASINDAEARADWNWKQEFGLKEMVADMLLHLEPGER